LVSQGFSGCVSFSTLRIRQKCLLPTLLAAEYLI
jgi:hypothetical protein